MKLTKEQLGRVDHISTGQIKTDIADTQAEIDQFEEELKPLMKNPPDNKVDIYMREGKISSRKHFIDKLNQILEYRKKQNN